MSKPTAYRRLTDAALDLLTRYFRVEISGLERIPKKGPAILIANHSGYSGADAVLLAHLIHRETGRKPRILAHHGYFDWSGRLRELCFRLRLREPHVSSAVRTLKHGHLLIVFPEGEAGNFKSSLRRYRLQPFHTGFLRMAELSGAPILPCLITGAEESYFNLGNINLDRVVRNLRVPLPINLVPLPAKWRIEILPPRKSRKIPSAARAKKGASPDRVRAGSLLQEQAEEIHDEMQAALREALSRRKFIYFGR